MSPIFYVTKGENDFVQEVSTHIQNGNSINDNEELFMDMQKFSCRENTDKN